MPASLIATKHTLAEVVGLTESVLGRKMVAIEADHRGASNAVSHVALIDGRACVVRISPREWRENVEAQVWAMAQCRSRGIPVPEVLTSDDSLATFRETYIIMGRLPGIPANAAVLSERERCAVLEQLGHYQFLMHTIELRGFGSLVPRPGTREGKWTSLWGYLWANCAARLASLLEEALPQERGWSWGL